MTSPTKLLLDTCAAIWLANGTELSRQVQAAITHAALADGVFVSPVTAWEIGMLANPSPGRSSLSFLPDPTHWFERLMAAPALSEAPLTARAAIAAATLPGDLHGDPADRLLIATARDIGATLVTRDSNIIAYAKAGHVQVLAC